MPDDIEEFLRRAAQRRAGRRPPVEPAPAPARPNPPRRIEPEIVDAEPIQDLPKHLAQYLDTTSFQQRAAHLAEEVDQADEKVEAHLHETFDHTVGDLTGKPASEPARPAAAPDSLLHQLARPGNLRQAIIFSEIFRRPEERW